jgi:DNA-binding MarR family transcriptional regulator
MPGTSDPSRRPFPPYDGDRYDLAHSVGYQLHLLMAAMRREIESRMAALGLTDAQWRPLWLLASGRATTANEVARLLEMDAGAVTRLLDRLEAKALVERVRSDADRRVTHLHLTAAGRQAVQGVPHVLAQVNNDYLRGFTEAEWRELLALVARLQANGAALAAQRGAG